MVEIVRVKNDTEIEGIRLLQKENLKKLISAEEAAQEGFVTAEYSFEFLKQMNNELLAKIDDLITRLHKYTNGQNHKRYYEKNKDKIKQSGATYLQKLKAENPEKIKEYSKRAYANKKKKLLDEYNSILQTEVVSTLGV